MIEWIESRIVPDWRDWYKWASVRGAGAFGAAVTALAANPDLLLGIVAFMPADPIQRAFMAAGVGLLAFMGPTVLRLLNQGASDDTAEAE